jgi:hypothetical protein
MYAPPPPPPAPLGFRGPFSGIFGLGRKFRIMDDDNSKQVSFAEFTKALRETGVIIDESSARKLFAVSARPPSPSLVCVHARVPCAHARAAAHASRLC